MDCLPSYNNCVVKNMRFYVMHSEYFFHWPAEVLALEKSSIRVVPKPNAQVSHDMLLFEHLEHSQSRLSAADSSPSHIVHKEVHLYRLVSLELVVQAFDQVLLQLARAQIKSAHGYPELCLLGQFMQGQVVIDGVLEDLDLTGAHLEARRFTLLDQVIEQKVLRLAELLHYYLSLSI